MKRIVKGIYAERIIPLIIEFYEHPNRESHEITEAYIDLITAEINIAFNVTSAVWNPEELREIVARFVESTSELQRRLLLYDIVEDLNIFQISEFEELDDGIDDILDEREENNLHFLPFIFIDEYKERVTADIVGGVKEGVSLRNIATAIYAADIIINNRVSFVAHDQVDELYAELNQVRQLNINCDDFEWFTMNDDRVRDTHMPLHSRVFPWKSGAIGAGVPASMVGVYPGEQWGCRCIAKPIIKRS